MKETQRQIVSLGLSQEEVYGGSTSSIVPYHRMYGKAYCLPSVAVYSPEELKELVSASEAMDRLFRKTLRFIQRYLPDSYLVQQLDIPPPLLPLVRKEVPLGGITRQDWIMGDAGMKIIENNADTPTGIPEAAYLEGQVLKNHTSWEGPSGKLEGLLGEELAALANYYAEAGLKPSVTFSCYDWHAEDRFNTLYLMEQLRQRNISAHYAPLEELEIVPGQGLFHNGRKIEIWYRLYPLEYLIEDREEDSGFQVGEALLDLAAQGKLGIINPPQNFIMQSKGFLATLWSLHERNHQTQEFCGFTLFDQKEQELIEKYCLPAYFSSKPFEDKNIPFAAKSYWGREGKGTEIIKDRDDHRMSGNVPVREDVEDEEILAYYNQQPKIYQQYWAMPEVQVDTEEGQYAGCLLTGAFVVGGRFGGILSRVGGRITGDGAYYCPAAILSSK